MKEVSVCSVDGTALPAVHRLPVHCFISVFIYSLSNPFRCQEEADACLAR